MKTNCTLKHTFIIYFSRISKDYSRNLNKINSVNTIMNDSNLFSIRTCA